MAVIGVASKILKRGVSAKVGTLGNGSKGVSIGSQKMGPRMGVKHASGIALGVKKGGGLLHHQSTAGKGGGKIHSFTTNKVGAAALGAGSVAAVGGPIWHNAHSGTSVKFRSQNKHPNVRGY